MLFALALYTLSALSLAPGLRLDVRDAANVGASEPLALQQTRLQSISRIGSIAVLAKNARDQSSVVVQRSDGSQVTLSLPSDRLLTEALPHGGRGVGDERTDFHATFQAIALAADGTPFALIGAGFSGAYSGEDECVLTWTGMWRIHSESRSVLSTANSGLGAVDRPDHFTIDANYFGTFTNLDAANADPDYQRDEALEILPGKLVRLGFGVAVAMHGPSIVGYDVGRTHVMDAGQSLANPLALEWTNGRRAVLGRGVAYGVNASSTAVGDDEAAFNAPGVPTVWQNGRVRRLTRARGTAFAIADDGTIVGQVGAYGFVMLPSSEKLVRLDAIIDKPDWHITAAYGISSDGTILARAVDGAGEPRVVKLKRRRQ